jgi:hypothetical protein
MEIARVPTKHAIAIYGESWEVDEVRRMAFQMLGRGRSPFYFGRLFATRDEALSAGGGNADRAVDLPERLLLPMGTPIVRGKVYLVRYDDLLARGLRVDAHTIASVDFSRPPLHMKGIVDCAATAVVLEGEERIRVRIVHESDGIPRLSTALRQRGLDWREVPEVAAYWNADVAIRAADELSLAIRRAASWRDNTCRLGGAS